MTSAHAEQWEIAPTASMSGEYSDNPRLLLHDAESAYGWIGNFQMEVARSTERSKVGLQSNLHYAHYTDTDDYDRNDRSLALDIQHQAEYSQWTTSVQFDRSNTLTSEFETTGLVRTNKIREAVAASAGVTHRLSESLAAGSELSWTNNHYRDAELTGLIDYDYGRASLFGEWQASDHSRWSIYANAGELRPALQRPETEDYSLMFRWTFVPWELWTVQASVGPSLSRSETERQEGALYALDVSRRTERGGWSISGSRERTPTGLGVLVLADRFSIATNRMLNEQLNVSLQGVVGRNRDQFTETAHPVELKYARVEAHLAWRFSPQLRFDLMLASMEQHNSGSPTAQNYSIALGFGWHGDPFHL